MKKMNTPYTRAEFERSFHLLHRQMAEERVFFTQGLSRVIESTLRVRFLPNGRIDFLSVDESARLEANMIANVSDGLFEGQFKKYQGQTDAAKGSQDSKSAPVASDVKPD